jgi:beta-glucosidase
MLVKFPPGFLWGSAISSYQVEGSNFFCDWFLWEKERGLVPAGEACLHYKLFPEDFKLASYLGHNALRFSIEWSRVEPQQDNFLEEELLHYLRVVEELKKNNLVPILTLHHFTNPIWFIKKGGWLFSPNIDYFLKYVTKISTLLKDHISYWTIFNEPLVYVYQGFIKGEWPPGYQSLKKARIALENIVKAYLLAYKEIKRICGSNSQVSLIKNMRVFSPCFEYNIGQNNLLSFLRSRVFNYSLIHRLKVRGVLDFLGLNYYCREYTRMGRGSFLGRECGKPHHKDRKNSLGWYIWPQGLFGILMSLKSLNLPIMITENGTSEKDQNLYQDFLLQHLKAVAYAIEEGCSIIGYMWWSLLDNFEWDKGYQARFGLIRVDFDNFQRRIKPFAFVYKKICQSNQIDI